MWGKVLSLKCRCFRWIVAQNNITPLVSFRDESRQLLLIVEKNESGVAADQHLSGMTLNEDVHHLTFLTSKSCEGIENVIISALIRVTVAMIENTNVGQ
jgi:hypothetical protein